MRSTISCSACGTVLGIPKAGFPADGLPCNWCGYVNVQAPEPAAAPARAKSLPAPVDPELPDWSDDEDDSKPYALPAEEAKSRPCVSCGKQIDLLAVVCVHCGYDYESGRKVERTFQPIDKEWAAGWSLRRRLGVFLAFQVLNAVSVAVSLSVTNSLPGSLGGIAFYVVLQAFLVGTYDTLRVRRNRKGQTEITITWRVAFVPLAPKKVNWREHEGVSFGCYDGTSVVDWILMILLLPACLFVAVFFWLYVIRSDRFYAALTRDRGFPQTYLYRGMNEAQAREIAQVATDATGLPLANLV